MEENKKENEKENILKKLLKKEIIISLVVGLILGLIIMFFVNGGIVARVGGQLVTAKSLYNDMKDYYSISLVLEDIDEKILDKKYQLSEEDKNYIKETADGYISQYEEYGYTEEDFLTENGFSDYEDFCKYLETDYKRTIYFYDTLEKTKLGSDDVKNYYNENAFGKVNTKHILVQTSDDMTDEQALALANEIITKLNDGGEFDALAEEYTTNYPENVITEDLGEIGAFDSIESSYIEAAKELEVGAYTETPVETSYGYHVIYCVDKKEKTEDISGMDRIAIITNLINEAGIEIDDTEYYKVLIQMREDANLKFFDKELKTKYDKYCEQYLETDEEE